MLDDTMNEQRTVEEGYTSATGASHLRIEAHRTGPADYIAAAGMSPYETGMMLMRLRSEWDRSAKPLPPTRAAIDRLADTLEAIPHGKPHAGMVAETERGQIHYRKPQEVAERTANAWYVHELGLLFQQLKTLPEVREELERWVGPPHAAHVVASVLGWWLDPTCRTCHGCGKRIVKNSGGRSSGKPCFACVMSPTQGQRPLPHAGLGRKLLAHINACHGAAKADHKQGMKPHRSAANIEQREQDRKHAKIAQLRRADEEGRAEDAQDRLKAAAHFAQHLARSRVRTP